MGGGPLLLPTFEEKLSSREDRAGGNTSLLGDPQWTHTEEMEILRTFEHTHIHTQPQKTPKVKVGWEQEQSYEPLTPPAFPTSKQRSHRSPKGRAGHGSTGFKTQHWAGRSRQIFLCSRPALVSKTQTKSILRLLCLSAQCCPEPTLEAP